MDPDRSAGSGSSGDSPDEDWGIGPVPAGYRFFQRRILIATTLVQGAASGDASRDAGVARAFERGRALLRSWGPQIGAGMRVEGSSASTEVGETATLRTRVCGVLPLRALTRIHWVADDRDRAGFGYETLPGHPEDGRESFVVTRGVGTEGFEEVWFTVTAYSKPAAWYARLGGPVTRMLQLRYANKYLVAIARAARAR
jgi:uncharacterized protein (UPF0548 family)